MSKNILIITNFMSYGGAPTFTRGLKNELLKDENNHLTIIYFYNYVKSIFMSFTHHIVHPTFTK